MYLTRLIQLILSLFRKDNAQVSSVVAPIPAMPLESPKLTVVTTLTQSDTYTPTEPDLSKWGLVPELEALAKKFLVQCQEKGYSLRVTQGLRTMAQQAKLYAQGRTTPGKIVTNAMPGQSQHNYGKAFDVCFTGNDPYPSDDRIWKSIADIGVSVGLTAGYYFHSFQDKPHFQID